MFEAVYIADEANNLLFQYSRSLSNPSFKLLHKRIGLAEKDVPPLVDLSNDFFVCIHRTANLRIYLLCSHKRTMNPLMPYAFIHRLMETMEDYFGEPLAASKIEANNDTLMLLLNEMMKEGIPNVADFNRLRDLVPYKSLLSRFLSTSNDIARAASNSSFRSTPSHTNLNSGLENTVPWRRSKVVYTKSEMYVDVTESISIILKVAPKALGSRKLLSSARGFDSAFYSTSSLHSDSRLVPISGSINGRIDFLSHLSGIPELQMILKFGQNTIEYPGLHECINLDKWTNDPGNLVFIPPDGKSTLMTYQIDLDSDKYRKQDFFDFGFVEVDPQFNLGNGNEFQLRIFVTDPKKVSKVEKLTVEVISDVPTEDSDQKGFYSELRVAGIKISRITHGDFSYKGNGKGVWHLRDISSDTQPLLRGSILAESEAEIDKASLSEVGQSSSSTNLKAPTPSTNSAKPLYLKLSYLHKGCVPSGITVDSLNIISAKGLNNSVKPFKGVKYTATTDNFIIRP